MFHFNDDFDRHFEKTQKTINRMFVFTAIVSFVGVLLAFSLVGAIIYLLVKIAGMM
jgi:hypothetical protein